ncbi:hypothetical protein IP92_05471 [Pseudoduganella flava]|uniref:Uncharacterized protein n=1 Tax=Pseudoduganella flava TaxID=871742 RepID=A0A562PDD4_9BURK|nr:hypothetical protein [Pseudoduganella flava]TWI42495.1 hypothetical protein IP92_05471 [Pseudoduganella flava]
MSAHDEARTAALAAALERDPVLANQLGTLRQQAWAGLDALVQEVAGWLAQQGPAPAAHTGPINVAALGAAARQRQALAREQRELAEAYVLGALVNYDNPDWNPLDPATSRGTGDSLLATLLTWEPPAPPADDTDT